MDKPLFTFEPYKQSLDVWTIALMGIVAACLIFIYFYVPKIKLDKTRLNIISMLLGFVAVIAGGFVVLRLVSKIKLTSVEIYNNHVKTPYGDVRFQDIEDFYIKIEKKPKMLNPNEITDSTRYFFIMEKSRKTHILSEGDYLIDSILSKMNYAVYN
jgi:hypothetical protein